jgi:hypothetical protein
MANAGVYGQQQMLNWMFGGAAATSPLQHYAGLCTLPPNSTAASELTGVALLARQPLTMSTVSTPGGISTNLNAFSFSIGASCTVRGIAVFDTATTVSGHMLFYNTLVTSWTCSSGDFVGIAAGQLKVTLF